MREGEEGRVYFSTFRSTKAVNVSLKNGQSFKKYFIVSHGAESYTATRFPMPARRKASFHSAPPRS